jgi:hypothetical protein
MPVRSRTRTLTTVAVTTLLSISLAAPAFAGQLIGYEGNTSAPTYNRVKAVVLKKDSGRRFLRWIAIRSVVTCEDASSFKISAIMGIGRLGEDGSFARVIQEDEFGVPEYVRVDGSIGFREGSGTYLYSTAKVIDDGTDSQLCTTGELTWTVERTSTQPARPGAGVAHRGSGFVDVRIAARHGH